MRRAHRSDVLDLAWAPDGTALVSTAMDANSVLWDAASARGISRFEDHKHFVQGAAWDPSARHIVTQSADRTCRHVQRGSRAH